MAKEAIRDWTGKIIGWEETNSNGNKTVRDFHGRVLGKYNSSLDITQDFHGRQVAKGDHLGIFIKKQEVYYVDYFKKY